MAPEATGMGHLYNPYCKVIRATSKALQVGRGSLRKSGVPYFGALIVRILLSPIFGNSHVNWAAEVPLRS